MAVRQIAIRVDDETSAQLKARAVIEGRSVNAIVTDAIREYSRAHPVSRDKMLEMVRRIAKEDEAILRALAKA